MDTRETVLVVESDALGLEVLADFLVHGGYRVVTAANGQEGFERLQNTQPPPFVVLLDWDSPIEDGREFLRKQMNDATVGRIPVIVLTVIRSPQIPGAKAILRKPANAQNLMELIDAISSAHSA